MANPGGSDKGLLDRLNALKPSTINLGNSSKSASVPALEPDKPVSREEGLSDRLKSLRSQVESSPSLTTAAGNEAQPHTVAGTSDTPLPATTVNQGSLVPKDDDISPLLDTDDQTLEELLADLGSDEQWLEEVATEFSRSKDEQHQKVTALLEELGDASWHGREDDTSGYRQNLDGVHNDDPGDDSDGEHMTRETNDVLAQAMDEAEWEKANTPQGSVAAAKVHNRPGSGEIITGRVSTDSFGLPAVPTELQDQPGVPGISEQDADFEAQITSRMAALKVWGNTGRSLPSAPNSEVDELGLPVVPTFSPDDQPLKGVYKRHGYTDDDAKTWCTVCLEDGAIRCFGCDDDIYCARCWKEMHVGPSAGYEERGHRWEKFIKGR
ncbi:hypothetical protein BKA67DRAFT_655993 [Truncatella angustata]|uniref:Abscission/NoCut checkpoint regulator n=1 Tax=Truncatella angustata TaxID=152316 RepID=A0A9P8UTK7_9PEZI|nr:uncharacterized protein BKA67DRAFT_655993 [Truncatella angustata]KAH6657750.1 hypothetical protein BKA67DRAFT_655993 [Truncatella angustata]